MAPRRVAPDLLDDQQDDDQDVRERRVRAAAGDDDQQDEGPEDEDEQDDDQQDEGEDDQQDDGADDADDAERERRPRRQREVREPDADLNTRLATAERIARETQDRLNQVLNSQPRPPQESPEQEAARMALMSPNDLIDYRVNKALRAHQQQTQAVLVSTSNAADKASFDTFIAAQPTWKKLAPEVETRHAAFVAKGEYPTRQMVLTWLLGERALKAAQEPEARRAAGERRRRVERQDTRPLQGRSDVQVQRRGGRSLEQRLENVQL